MKVDKLLPLITETLDWLDKSKDPSTQNVATLFDDNLRPIVTAVNNFPAGVAEKPERWDKPIKYKFVEHAERNVIYKAAKWGIPTKGLKMFCPWFACADCARAIIQAGISEVIGFEKSAKLTNDRWKDLVGIGDLMLDEAGVKRIYIDNDQYFFNKECLRDGKMVKF